MKAAPNGEFYVFTNKASADEAKERLSRVPKYDYCSVAKYGTCFMVVCELRWNVMRETVEVNYETAAT